MTASEKKKLIELLKKLDAKNDNHWTMEGLPQLNILTFLNNGVTVSREQLTEAAPEFNRASYTAYLEKATPPSPPSQEGVTNATQAAPGVGAGIGNADVGTQQPEVEIGANDGKTVLEAVAEAFDRAEQTVLELERIQAEVGKELTDARLERDRLHDERLKLIPVESNQNVIQNYLASQKRILAERARMQGVLSSTGVDLRGLAKLTQRAPIDVAMMSRPRSIQKR